MSVSRQKGISYMPQPSAASLYLTNQQKYSLNKLQKQHQNLANQIENNENREQSGLRSGFESNQNQDGLQNGKSGNGYPLQKNQSEFLNPQKQQFQSNSLDFKMPQLTKAQTSKNEQYRSQNNLMLRSRNFFGNNRNNEQGGPMQKRTLTSGQNKQQSDYNISNGSLLANTGNYTNYQYGSNLGPRKILGQQDQQNSSRLPKLENIGVNKKLDALHQSLHLSQLGQNSLNIYHQKNNSQPSNFGVNKTNSMQNENKINNYQYNSGNYFNNNRQENGKYNNTLKQNASNIILPSTNQQSQQNSQFKNNYSQNFHLKQNKNNGNEGGLQNSMLLNQNANGNKSSKSVNQFLQSNKIDNEQSILHKNYQNKFDITHNPYEDEQNKKQQSENSIQKNRNTQSSNNNNENYDIKYKAQNQESTENRIDRNMNRLENNNNQNGFQSFMNKPIIVQKDNTSVQIGDKVFKYAYKTKAGCTYQKQTKTNQDSAIVNPQNPKDAGFVLFAVADGHGVNGHFVSQQIKASLPKTIQTNLNNVNQSDSNQIINGLSKAVLQTNQEIITSNYDTNLSGSTLISVLTNGKQIWTANVGDSRSVMARQERGGIKAIPMSVDLKPCLERERLRVIKAGGRVDRQKDYSGYPVGPLRVWLKNLDIPGLAMTRSIGDKVGNQAGVIPDPEIIESTIQNDDKFMVIASDGVWEYMNDQEVIKLVAPYVEKGQLELACEKLVSEATLTWKRESFARDDITAIIVTISQNKYGNNNNLQSNNNNFQKNNNNNYGQNNIFN